MADGTEVPPEFYFAAGLTFFGALSGQQLSVDAKLVAEPRLYTVLLGESGEAHKSTPIGRTEKFFESIIQRSSGPTIPALKVVEGTGSAEGLAKVFTTTPSILLCYDELKSLMDKAKVQASVLLPMVASMFEKTSWSNHTKDKSTEIANGHLSLLAGCTTETYATMWSTDSLSIGLPNRLFIVMADRRNRVAWPEDNADPEVLAEIGRRILRQLGRLPLKLSITPEAKARWEQWYAELPSSIHTKRLDAIGIRLMMLLALTTDKDAIDLETVQLVIEILDYELAIRVLNDPIDADSAIAAMEEKIRRQLKGRGPQRDRDLKRHTNANRVGLWVYQKATDNLSGAGEITRDHGWWKLVGTSIPEQPEEVSSNLSSLQNGA